MTVPLLSDGVDEGIGLRDDIEEELPVVVAQFAGHPLRGVVLRPAPELRPHQPEGPQGPDPVPIVNSDKTITENQRKLDFESDKVWRILIGGTKLSRGFTVEGLTISYYRRKAGQADTLMQAGRWFGFRPGYQDLVRLYIRRDSQVDLYEAFEALLLDEEAFRDELRQYEGFDEDGMPLVEPRQIPPLVSQHLPWLRPTARNKMWNAVIDSKATAKGFQDLYGLPPRGRPENRSNLEHVGIPLLQRATSSAVLPYDLSGSTGSVPARIGTLSATDFLKLFEQLVWHEEWDVRIEPLKRFLEKATTDGRIVDWAVVWPQPTKQVPKVPIDGLGSDPVPVITRKRRVDRIDFIGSDAKHRDAALPIARGESVPGLPGKGGRGALLVTLVDDRPDSGGTKAGALAQDTVVVLVSMAVPASATPHKRDLIQWTVRVQAKAEDAAVDVDA